MSMWVLFSDRRVVLNHDPIIFCAKDQKADKETGNRQQGCWAGRSAEAGGFQKQGSDWSGPSVSGTNSGVLGSWQGL